MLPSHFFRYLTAIKPLKTQYDAFSGASIFMIFDCQMKDSTETCSQRIPFRSPASGFPIGDGYICFAGRSMTRNRTCAHPAAGGIYLSSISSFRSAGFIARSTPSVTNNMENIENSCARSSWMRSRRTSCAYARQSASCSFCRPGTLYKSRSSWQCV